MFHLLMDSARPANRAGLSNEQPPQENQFLTGYEFQFVNAVDEDFICPVCTYALRSPIVTSCGHRFCKGCIDKICDSENNIRESLLYSLTLDDSYEPRVNCPVCRIKLIRDRDIFPDKFTERKILSLIIKCPHDGCTWTGELSGEKIHRASCPEEAVECTIERCKETMARKQLQEHVSRKCQWRMLDCKHCTDQHPVCQHSDHLAKCKRFPVKCANDCGKTIPREEMMTHTGTDCPKAIVPCPFEEIDCQIKIFRSEIGSHIKAATSDHLDLARKKLITAKEEREELKQQMEETTRELQEKFEYLMKENEQIKETTRKLQEKLIYTVTLLSNEKGNPALTNYRQSAHYKY